jgi:MOSC domain-containing protein YiiM
MTGYIASITIAAREGGELIELSQAYLITDRGIEGDRYCQPASPPNVNQISLVESEVVADFATKFRLDMQPIALRRNIVTQGSSLNDLVGKRFLLGTVEAIGTELAEPCRGIAESIIANHQLENVTAKEIVSSLVHRGGLYARIVQGGLIKFSDSIQVLP